MQNKIELFTKNFVFHFDDIHGDQGQKDKVICLEMKKDKKKYENLFCVSISYSQEGLCG
jgi:hypothetical protein